MTKGAVPTLSEGFSDGNRAGITGIFKKDIK